MKEKKLSKDELIQWLEGSYDMSEEWWAIKHFIASSWNLEKCPQCRGTGLAKDMSTNRR